MSTEDRTAVVLSTQQRAVLALSATGLTAAGVASALHLSVRDVHEQLAAASAALGARSKLEAVLIAVRHGVIELPSD